LEKLNWPVLLVSATRLKSIKLDLCARRMRPATPIKEIASATGSRKH